MIISASRRTDLPAFYAEWLMQRIRAGFCEVPNPFNARQVSRVSLAPDDVDVIVFWTRHARPLLAHLDELDARGYRYYFQYTVLDYPRSLERATPPAEVAVQTVRELAQRVGPQRVIWRYDPIVFGPGVDAEYHLAKYATLAAALEGATRRSVISIVDLYRQAAKRLHGGDGETSGWSNELSGGQAELERLLHGLAATAPAHGLEITSCAEEADLTPYDICPGKCVDADLIRAAFGLELGARKDPGQRDACGCVVSKDIGMYTTCVFGCQYCYATSSFARAQQRHATHDPSATMLIP